MHTPIGDEPGGGGSASVIGASGNGGFAGSSAQAGNAGSGGSATGGAGGVAGTSGGSAGNGSAGSSGGGAGGTSGGAPNFGGTAGFIGYVGDGGPDPNLIVDPGFESGLGNWVPLGNPSVTWHEGGALAGTHCLKTTNRTEAWMGPSYPLTDVLTAGATYDVSFWVRTGNPDIRTLMLSQKVTCLPVGEPTTYTQILPPFAARNYWAHVEGQFVAPACELQEFVMYVEGPIGEDIYVDEVRLVEVAP